MPVCTFMSLTEFSNSCASSIVKGTISFCLVFIFSDKDTGLVKHAVRGVGKVVGGVTGGLFGRQKQPDINVEQPAQAAAPAAQESGQTDVNIDTAADKKKRKAKGKKGLMINAGANASGGTTGTGLNI